MQRTCPDCRFWQHDACCNDGVRCIDGKKGYGVYLFAYGDYNPHWHLVSGPGYGCDKFQWRADIVESNNFMMIHSPDIVTLMNEYAGNWVSTLGPQHIISSVASVIRKEFPCDIIEDRIVIMFTNLLTDTFLSTIRKNEGAFLIFSIIKWLAQDHDGGIIIV